MPGERQRPLVGITAQFFERAETATAKRNRRDRIGSRRLQYCNNEWSASGPHGYFRVARSIGPWKKRSLFEMLPFMSIVLKAFQ
jgi:hypothetical protein